jgi:hypothetical protein
MAGHGGRSEKWWLPQLLTPPSMSSGAFGSGNSAK